MTRADALLAELEHEARTTRTHLVRLPEAHFDWRPHPKSYTAGALASHLVDCLRFAAPIFVRDELAVDLSSYRPFRATTTAGLLAAFDEEVSRALQAIAGADDRDATGLWRMLVDGRVLFERSREAAFRDMTLNHLIHHRGQLSVYLRLLDVAVPWTYGPTADEQEPAKKDV